MGGLKVNVTDGTGRDTSHHISPLYSTVSKIWGGVYQQQRRHLVWVYLWGLLHWALHGPGRIQIVVTWEKEGVVYYLDSNPPPPQQQMI